MSYTVTAIGDTRVNATTANAQAQPSTTALADGGWLVTWSSDAQDGSGYGVYQQRYDSGGVASGAETRVNTTTAADQQQPSTTALKDGGWLVTWSSSGQSNGFLDGIYQQRYDSAGVASGPETRVETTNGGFQPSTAVLADGGWLVTWTTFGQDGVNFGVYQQRYDSAGVASGAQTRVNTTTVSDQYQPSTTALKDGGWLVTWSSYGQDGPGYGIFQQRYDSAGVASGAETRVNIYTAGNQFLSSTTTLADGGWLVTWSSDAQDGSGYGVYQQRYTSAGAATGGEVQVNTFTLGYQYLPSTTALKDGGWLVTWSSDGQDGSSYGVYQQRYDSAGVASGAETRVNTYTSNDQSDPSTTALADGGWLVTWTSFGQDGSGYGIFQQRYTSAGVAVEGAPVQDAVLSAAIERADGSAGDDVFLVAPGALGAGDIVNGGLGTDSLRLTGAGTLDLTAAGVTFSSVENLDGSSENDTLTGDANANVLTGNGGADTLIGNGGADTLDGGAGDDQMTGGTGNDVYFVDAVGDAITEAAGDAADEVRTTLATFTLGVTAGSANVERLTGLLSTGQTLIGDAGANVITGGGGDDILRGGAGADALIGGAGADTADYSTSAALTVRLGGGGPASTGDAAGDTFTGIENVTGGAGNDFLYGDASANVLSGAGGDDFLFGMAGIDTLIGGLGNDRYQLTTAGDEADIIIEAVGGGTDFVITNLANYTLVANVENLVGVGSTTQTLNGNELSNDISQLGTGSLIADGGDGDDFLRGGAAADTLTGGAGNDAVFGGAGADTFIGGAGVDVASYFFETGSLGVVASLAAGLGTDTFGATDTFATIENLAGSANNDSLTGDGGVNRLSGYDGDDLLVGGAGADTIDGGLGIDAVDYGGSVGAVTINLLTGVNTGGDAQGDVLTGVESVTGSGGADVLTGGLGDDRLFGGIGVDTLTGGDGNDVLVGHSTLNQFTPELDVLNGGNGNDLIYGEAADSIDGGAGTDALITINAYDFAIDLAATSIEYAILDFGNDTVTAANQTQGVSVFASGGNDTVTGSNFNDTIFLGIGDDVGVGGTGNDVIVGEGGSDRLVGGAGNDALYGGAGDGVQDTFVFSSAGAADADAIYDFVHGVDKIDMSAFGTTFAHIGITSLAGAAIVFLDGQHVATVVGAAGTLTASDFIFSSPAPGQPQAADPTVPVVSVDPTGHATSGFDDGGTPTRDVVFSDETPGGMGAVHFSDDTAAPIRATALTAPPEPAFVATGVTFSTLDVSPFDRHAMPWDGAFAVAVISGEDNGHWMV